MAAWLNDDFEPGLVSVIIPTYNRAGLLGEALASVLAQKHGKVEAVVVDDGSGDETASAVEAWRGRFRSERGWALRFFRQEHLGGQKARNRGARESRGEFLNYLDDDDLLTAEKISAQAEIARQRGADIVYGPWVPFTKGEGGGCALGRPHCRKPLPGDRHPFLAWLEGRSWKLMASLVARRFAARVGPGNEELKLADDLEYIARCLSRAPSTVYSPRGALLRREHPASLSHQGLSGFEETLIRYASLLEEYVLGSLPGAEARPALARYMARHAVSYRVRGSVRAAAHFAQRALHYDPGFRPDDESASTRLAYRLAGFRGWALKKKLRSALRRLRRRLGLTRGGYRPVPALPLEAWPPGAEAEP